jgi:hypothetical protein
MNPLAVQRPRRAPSAASILAGAVIFSLVALYWLGKLYNP